MEFGNDYLRQQEVAAYRGLVYHKALMLGKSTEKANQITDEVTEQANTTFSHVEPVNKLVSKLTDYYCLFPDSLPTFPACPEDMFGK